MDSFDDVSIVKVTSGKSQSKGSAWVLSSFDDFQPAVKPLPHSNSRSSRAYQPFTQPLAKLSIQTKLSSFKPSSSKDSAAGAGVSRKRQRGDSVPAHRLLSAVKSDSKRDRLKSALSSDLWADKYKPQKIEELAVHKKKVEEICSWLRDRSKRFTPHAAPILLLTGAPGAGKTAAVSAIAADLKLDVREWASPSAATGGDGDFRAMSQADWMERSSVDVFSSQSQSSQFKYFLLRANKYQALQLDSSVSGDKDAPGKFILVEDIPNAFYREPSELHNILRTYSRCGHCPLVFIVSDASHSSTNVQRLFPSDLQEELRLHTINVNPVAPTMMVKVLNRIAGKEASLSHFALPSARVVESIAMSSAGDVRSALNALQFACRQDTLDLNRLQAMQQRCVKKERSGSGRRLKYGGLAKQDSGSSDATLTQTSVIGAKDTACFLFHALGKILHFKRGNPANNSEHQTLPPHLSQHDRDPLLMTPEEVVEKTHLTGDYFNTFLHQNYLDFMSSVENIDRASEYLSEADLVSAQYTSRGQLQDYSVSVATRGFIHSESSISRHTDSRQGLGWRPLHKSQWFSTQKQSQQSKASAMRLFRGYHWQPEVLLTELVPYISLINPTLHDPGQISFVQNLCQYSRSFAIRPRLEKLEEKCAVDDSDVEDENYASSSSALAPPTSSSTSQAATLSSASTSKHQTDNINITDDGDDLDLPSSQKTVQSAPEEAEDEDFVIEEFDD